MKYLFLSLISCCLMACGASAPETSTNAATTSTVANENPPAGPANIQVQVKGLSGGQARLIGMYTEQNYLADTATVDAQGRFTFDSQEGYKQGFYFFVLPDNTNFQVLIDDDQEFSITTTAGRLVEDMQIEGSIAAELFYESLRFEQELAPRFTAVNQKLQSTQEGTPEYAQYKKEQDMLVTQRKEYVAGVQKKYPNNLFTKFKTAGQNPDLLEIRRPDGKLDTQAQIAMYRRQFWDNVDFNDVRLLYTPVIQNKLKRYLTELTTQHPDSIVEASSLLIDKVINHPQYFQYFANWVLINYDPEKTTLMDPQAVFVNTVNKYFTYDRAFWSDSTEIYAIQLRAHEMSSSLVGQKGPNVQAPGVDGQTKAIYDIKSPYIIVYMWDPNCDQCAIETPKMVQFSREWKNKGVEVYSIALNTNDTEWKNYINNNGLGGWTNVFDPSNRSIYATYYVDHTPEIYVLNPDRTIIGKNLKVEQIPTVIQRDQQGS